MPRFSFDISGARAVCDPYGMIFADCQVAGRFAEELAAHLTAARPELRNKASEVMTEARREGLTYCISIGTARPSTELVERRAETPGFI